MCSVNEFTAPGSSPADPGPWLVETLRDLGQIAAAINRIGPDDRTGMQQVLDRIAQSAARAVPGAWAAIWAYDPHAQAFDLLASSPAYQHLHRMPAEASWLCDLGRRALAARCRILSYDEPGPDAPGGHASSDVDRSLAPCGRQDAPAHAGTAGCFPLLVAEQETGTFCVVLESDRPFGSLELLALETLANQAATAMYQPQRLASVQHNLARKEEELNRLRRAGLLISSRLGLEETLQAILQMALEVTGAHYGIFRLLDKSGQNLITRAIAGESLGRPMVEALPVSTTSIMGWVAQHRQPVCIRDLYAEPWNRIYYPLDAALKMRSELAVPLIGASGRLEGVLNLESPAVGAFGEEDSHLLQSLATQAVIAIQEVRLLDALQEVAQRLLVQPRQEVLGHLVVLACDLLNAAASAIWTLEGDELVLQASSSGYERGERVPLHGSLTGQAVLCNGPVVADDVRTDPRFHRRDLAQAQGWARALVVPVLASSDREGNPVGAFSVYSTGAEPGRFAESEWDEKVLTCLAHYAALAVHNAARQEALRAAQEQRAVAETFAAIGDIAANVLHHLNNKVGTIPVRIQGIQDKSRPALLADGYLATNLSEIERSALEAMEAVRENLSHLRPIHLAPVDVAACVSAAIQDVSLLADVRVEMYDLDGLPAVAAAQRSLTLVFANLLENAIEALKGHGVMTIRGTSQEGWIEIAVSDNGPGIAPELQDRIFEFEPARGAAARPGKLGFGLWWVKTLMARLGGAVAVESDGRHGTTFRLRLPRAKDRP